MRPVGLRGSPIQPCDGRRPVPNCSQYCALSHPIEIGLCTVLYEAKSNWQVLIPVYADPKEGFVKPHVSLPFAQGQLCSYVSCPSCVPPIHFSYLIVSLSHPIHSTHTDSAPTYSSFPLIHSLIISFVATISSLGLSSYLSLSRATLYK